MSSNIKAKNMNNNMELAEYKPEPYDNMKFIREMEKLSEQQEYKKEKPLTNDVVYKVRSDGNRICTPLELKNLDSYDLSYKGYDQKDNNLLVNAEKFLMTKDGEDFKHHLYLDTFGHITVGLGANLDDYNEFMKTNLQKDCRSATHEEKDETYQGFQKLKKDRKYGKNYPANFYEEKSPLYVSDTHAIEKMQEHLRKDIYALKKHVDGFNDFPQPLKEALVDFRYSKGNITRENFPELRNAIDKRDLSLIEKHIYREGIGDKRNQIMQQKINSIPEHNGWYRSCK